VILPRVSPGEGTNEFFDNRIENFSIDGVEGFVALLHSVLSPVRHLSARVSIMGNYRTVGKR